ncbi:MAG: gluconate 2-dehydrogenase subunit 3 family protein [Chloroflexota bacterium]
MTDQANEHLPVDPQTGNPLAPRAQPGYYPGFHTLDQKDFWDEATRTLVLDRVENVPPLRFFDGDAALAAAIFDRILPQDDRDAEHRIPVVHYVDQRLWEGISNGYRHPGAPSNQESYRLGFQGIEAASQRLHGKSFLDLGPREQDEILLSLQGGGPPDANGVWAQLDPIQFFELLVTDAVEAYYAHPYAWDEVGFGGPSYPRGYMRLEKGLPEPWEVDEQRYEWEAPPSSLSGAYHPLAGLIPQRARPNQGGTH